jgi:threonine/homoserine/homoserine lactone efflux protein
MLFYLSTVFFAFLAAISPGPNIVLVTSNSIAYGKKIGLMSAFGVLTGVIIWLLCLLVGFNYLLENPKVIVVFNCFACLYLIYIAYHIFNLKIITNEENQNKSHGKFFVESFISTILNPEIAIFYGSILTGVLNHYPEKHLSIMILYLISFMCIESVVFLSAVIASSSIRRFIFSYFKIIKTLASLAILYYSMLIMWQVVIERLAAN